MHDHFEQGDGGDADILEVAGVAAPGSGVVDDFLVDLGVVVESVAVRVDELDGVLELWKRVSAADQLHVS